MSGEQVLMTARGAIEELTSREILKCASSITILNMLAPELFEESEQWSR